MQQESKGRIQGRYAQLESLREPFLTRARRCSELTIPTLVPPQGHNSNTNYPTPYQGLGARGVNNLAAKLLLALLPPNSPFFRLIVDDFTVEKMAGDQKLKSKVEEALAKIERAVMRSIETKAIRVSAFEALKHLLVAGNVLLFLPTGGGMRVFHLHRYVVRRDPMGGVLEIITHETVAPGSLSDKVRDVCGVQAPTEREEPNDVDVYTYVRLSDDQSKWEVSQEINGIEVPGSKGSYPLKKSPWIPLRFTKIDGEDYGRGYVEEYLGDLVSLEELTKAIVKGSAAASKVVFLVNPNSTTKAKDMAQAESGDFKSGKKDDITVLQMEKFNDFRVAFETIKELTERLAYAFLLHSAIQRDAERVTAEEVRLMASDLEDALGGTYSILSQEFQLPLVRTLLHQMERSGELPALPEGVVEPAIVTGLEALGRGQDLQKLTSLLQVLSPLGPEVISQHLNVADYISRCATALGVSPDGLIFTDEEREQMSQQNYMQQLMQQLGPEGLRQLGGVVQTQLKNQQGEPVSG